MLGRCRFRSLIDTMSRCITDKYLTIASSSRKEKMKCTMYRLVNNDDVVALPESCCGNAVEKKKRTFVIILTNRSESL
uniref:Uncharacterized protein n=1 Tax=Pristionchus pacificus TaxID=54126 RepID=A0A2A6BQB2_PRIPA|eukprot:PDM68058.1 hypothetical protein PRIPAC_46102 [Pristionchus pacificus]